MARLYQFNGNTYDYLNSPNVDSRYRTNRKDVCIGCGNKSMTPIVNTETGEPLGDCGVCDRANNCGYSYSPIQYFKDNEQDIKPVKRAQIQPVRTHTNPVEIPISIVEQSRLSLKENTLIPYLNKLFTPDTVNVLSDMYLLGSSNGIFWGGVVFWFIGIDGRVWFGQIKSFDENGHTDTYTDIDTEAGTVKVKKCTKAIQSALFKQYKLKKQQPPQWLTDYNSQSEKVRCFFGEHLLNLPENIYKPIAIVEAPKTAIICAGLFPEYVWISAGAMKWLTVEKCQVLKGRRVLMFPDLAEKKEQDDTEGKKQPITAYEYWHNVAEQIKGIADVECSDILELFATAEQRAAGADLADILEAYAIDYKNAQAQARKDEAKQAILQRFEAALKDLIETGATDEEIKSLWYSYWNNNRILDRIDLPLIIKRVLINYNNGLPA